MTAALSLAIELADEIERFPLGECGPSDDPDKQYAYVAGFRDIAKRFVAAVKRMAIPTFLRPREWSRHVSTMDL